MDAIEQVTLNQNDLQAQLNTILDAQDDRERCERFRRFLDPFFRFQRVEQSILYPAFQQETGFDTWLDKAMLLHRSLSRRAETIALMIEGGELALLKAELSAFSRSMKSLIELDQEEIFPFADRSLSKPVREKLSRTLAAQTRDWRSEAA